LNVFLGIWQSNLLPTFIYSEKTTEQIHLLICKDMHLGIESTLGPQIWEKSTSTGYCKEHIYGINYPFLRFFFHKFDNFIVDMQN